MELYFDNAATTPLLPEIKDLIVRHLDIYGNPSSLHHIGVAAEKVLTQARRQLLRDALWPGQAVFTGCGTEANNLAIFGTCLGRDRPGHVVTTAIEHPAVLEPMEALRRRGWDISYVRPNEAGVLTAEAILSMVREDTVLVSVMHVNNETGDILPIQEIAKGLRSHPKVRFHVDGIQAFGKLSVKPGDTGANLYSISGHKLGAPKGIGALLIQPGAHLHPVLLGGGQEGGLRSGTENVVWAAALAEGGRLAVAALPDSFRHVSELKRRLGDGLSQLPGCVVDNRPTETSPYILNVAFPGLKGEVLVHSFAEEELYVSTGSACSSKGGHATDSHVLRAVGKSAEEVQASVRLSLARWQTAADVDRALDIIDRKSSWLRRVMG